MVLLLCREVDYINPYQYKGRTARSGAAWEQVAVNLRHHGFQVEKRGCQEKFKKLKETIKKRNAKELRESGIAPELTEEEQEITKVVEDMEESEKEAKEFQGEAAAEETKKHLTGVEMRKRAMETFSETNKR